MPQGKPTFPNTNIRQLGVVYAFGGEVSTDKINETLEGFVDNQHPVTLSRSRARLVRLGGLSVLPLHTGSPGRPFNNYSLTRTGEQMYLESFLNGQNHLGFHLRLAGMINGGDLQAAQEQTAKVAGQLLELDLYVALMEQSAVR